MGYLADITKQINKGQDVIFVGTGVILVSECGKILIAKRVDNGQWSIPGGSLEIGESLEECAIRETYEETGILIEETNLMFNCVKAINEPVDKGGISIHIVSVSYWAECSNKCELDIDCKEFSEYKWVSKNEISDLDNITTYSRVAITNYIGGRL